MSEPAARPKRRGVYLLPNLMTTGCLFSGFYAIIAAIDNNFERAAIAVFVAMLFDGLDGRIARWTGTESNFGKEYDSLADMVAFGLAPALVTYQWGVVKIAEYGDTWRRFAWVVAFFYAVAAALRLARFNARAATADKRYFEGLPSPSAAAVVAAFVWFFSAWREPGLTGLMVAIIVTASAGALMVSSFSYVSLKQVDVDRRVKVAYFFVVVAFLYGIAFDPPTMLFALFATYAMSAPTMWLWRKLTRTRRTS
jgi:CDP-diacylglycerol--serine O-phosphatidyltransferase